MRLLLIASGVLCVAIGGGSPHVSNTTDCECPWTSSNRVNCCSDGGKGGEGSGDFCGNWFQKTHCNGTTPVCCNSDISASCGVLGSSCSPGCILGYKGVGTECKTIPPPAPSPASEVYARMPQRAIANLAAAAGCGPEEKAHFKDFKCKECQSLGFDIAPGTMRFVTHNDLFTKNATFAYIARLQAVGDQPDNVAYDCVIGNRGSVNLVNYIEDAEFWRQKPTDVPDCDGCQVHSGFYHAWADLEKDALAALAELGCTPNGPNNKVLITGHSLGAAASVVAMFSLKAKGFDVQQTIVFELPRVGNKAFSEAFAKQFTQPFPVFVHTHAMDPVVHLPWQGIPGIDYHHIDAPEVYYFPSYNISQYIVCEGADDPLCSSRYALLDTITSGDDHCKGIYLAPNVDPNGNVPNFCYYPSGFCSGDGGDLDIVV